jgi:hypothetical protein
MPRPTRTNTTLLLVCEGYAEVELARVVREIYLPRGCGTSLRSENCRGYGATAALELAIQRQAEGAYEHVGILVDTDQHWSDACRRHAEHCGISAVECIPCLEAMLLTVDGRRVHERTADNKAAFEEAYGSPANRSGVIARHFPREKFDNSRHHVLAVDRLLTFLRC